MSKHFGSPYRLHWHVVIICGARDWSAVAPIRKVLAHLQRIHGSKLIVITGGASGADSIAAELCLELGIHVAVMPALWDAQGKGAGPRRNRAMLALDPDEVIAFHEALHLSKGTKDMVELARRWEVRRRLWVGAE